MARMTPDSAKSYASIYRIPLDRDYHALNSDVVHRILELATELKYRVPANANGSKARYFHAYLVRTAKKTVEG